MERKSEDSDEVVGSAGGSTTGSAGKTGAGDDG